MENLPGSDLPAAHLVSELRKALETYRRGGNGKRKGIMYALNALAGFVLTLDEQNEEGLALPIMVLEAALLDVADGKPHPLLQAKRKAGRGGESTMRKALRGYAVRTVDLLIQTGLTPRDAAERVAKTLRTCKVARHRGRGIRIEAGTVLAWRKAVSGDYGKGIAAEIHASLMASATLNKNLASDAARKDLLTQLAVIARAAG